MFAAAIVTGICLGSVIVSYIAFRRGFTRSADDYFVAGSSLGYFVLIFSMLASFLSAFCMVGMSSFGYRLGFGSLFVLTVNLIPLGFLWYFMHRKTFLLGRARKWMSMGAPFGERYGNEMRVLIPLVVMVASIPYLAAQIQGIALMIEVMSQEKIPFQVGRIQNNDNNICQFQHFHGNLLGLVGWLKRVSTRSVDYVELSFPNLHVTLAEINSCASII